MLYLCLLLLISQVDIDYPPIEAEPVWLEMEVDFTGGGLNKRFRVSGTGISAFVGQAIQVFGTMAQ